MQGHPASQTNGLHAGRLHQKGEAHLVAVAHRALGLVRHTLAAALVARLLHLHVKPGRHLLLHDAEAPAVASGALLGGTVLRTSAAALLADDVAGDAARARTATWAKHSIPHA